MGSFIHVTWIRLPTTTNAVLFGTNLILTKNWAPKRLNGNILLRSKHPLGSHIIHLIDLKTLHRQYISWIAKTLSRFVMFRLPLLSCETYPRRTRPASPTHNIDVFWCLFHKSTHWQNSHKYIAIFNSEQPSWSWIELQYGTDDVMSRASTRLGIVTHSGFTN